MTMTYTEANGIYLLKAVSAFTGDKWEWVDTVSARWNAIARVKGLSVKAKKKRKLLLTGLQ